MSPYIVHIVIKIPVVQLHFLSIWNSHFDENPENHGISNYFKFKRIKFV